MKRVLILLCTLAVSVTVWGQGKINTRKYILSDFNDKVIQLSSPEKTSLTAD